MKIMATSFKKSHARTDTLSAPDPEAGHSQPTPLQRLLLTGKSGSVSCGVTAVFSWCAQGFACALQESVSPVLCKFCNQIPLASKVKFPGVCDPMDYTIQSMEFSRPE